jgi:cell wall assembly regulator SMI1
MVYIELKQDAFLINQVKLSFPLQLEKLMNVLGDYRHTSGLQNNIFTWDNLGILAYSQDGIVAENITINLKQKDYQFSPKCIFNGLFLIENVGFASYYHTHAHSRIKQYRGEDGGSFVFNHIRVWFGIDDRTIEVIQIDKHEATPAKPIPQALALDKEFECLLPLWQSWINEITKLVPLGNKYYNLIRGIVQDDLDQYSKLEDGSTIPQALINFYKVHDVDYDAVTSPFSFSVNGWDYELIPFKDIASEWSEIQSLQFGDDIESENMQDYSEKVKADDYANPKWIPFATGRNGDYLLLDTDPSNLGGFGQIIELQNESWSRLVVADSLADLVQKEINLLQSGKVDKFDFILDN